MANVKLTMALSHYDRHIPLFDGSVRPEGVDLQVLEVGQSNPLKHGQDRHERMLQKGEFDICELSLSSYLIAKSRGMPFTAIPVFPRRLFSLSQTWVNANAGIHAPRDLIGKKVGLSTFQTTLSVLAKGDLQAEYDVPWRKIAWYISKDEAVPLKPIEGVKPKCDQKAGIVTITATDDAAAQKAINALAEAGFHGKSSNDKLAMKDDSGVKAGKVKSITLTGIHNCCGMCCKGIKEIVKKVDGVSGDTAKPKVNTFEVTGDFDAAALVKALNDAGFHVKVKK